MAASLVGDDLARQTSSRRSWRSSSVREMWNTQDVFQRSSRQQAVNEEEELKWAAIERLPTYDRMKRGMLRQYMSNGRVVAEEVDVAHLGDHDKKQLMESILKVVEDDNERFLKRLRARNDRVGIDIPKVEVRYQNISIEGDAYVGTRALPTLLNSTLNQLEGLIGLIGLSPSKKRVVKILHDVSGIVKPSRMTLLLGPPSSGKTTLLKALAGKLDRDIRVTGKVTYCGHEFKEFVPQRTSAYISQHDLHYGEMTVRETLDFSGRCLGVGTRYDMLVEMSRREKDSGVKPDPEIDAFMKATSMSGKETSLITDYVLKILGLDICADIMVGDGMRRGISGGQKKRVTTGEMLVGPAKAFFMDEISTGLDSSTTFQIVKFMRQMVHILDVTMIISLLQPAPEAYDLFDDIILISEGQIVYQGPRENVLEFFEYMGFRCPERKGVADFLQEVTSKKDQEQYWYKKNQPYRYVSVPDFVQAFRSFHVGQRLLEDLRVPYDKRAAHPAALVKEKYGISNMELFKACFAREWLLMQRNSFLYIFKTCQISIMATIAFTVFLRTTMKSGKQEDTPRFWGALFFSLINVMFNGVAELPMTVFRLPVFFKQRDALFYPGWAFALPIWITRIPISLMESFLWTAITYYTIGFAPAPIRFFKQFLAFFGIHQMAVSLFRFIAGLGRSEVVSGTIGSFTLLLVFILGGYIVAKDDIQPWMIWGYYVSPMMYGQNAIAINEFLSDRWSTPVNNSRMPTVGKNILRDRGLYTDEYWYWICVAALFGFSVLFNVLFIASLTFLNPLGETKTLIENDDSEIKRKQQLSNSEGIDMQVRNAQGSTGSNVNVASGQGKRGMVMPFQPLSLAFNHVNYYVDMPVEMKSEGIEETRCNYFEMLVVHLGRLEERLAGTLKEVLASLDTQRTKPHLLGSAVTVNRMTFIHHMLLFMNLSYTRPGCVLRGMLRRKNERHMFVDEVMDLVELNPLRNSLVGLPGVDGLSTEQRKRLTIAVELVANPSIIFMDEPTSGLDARAAAIVMRTVRNTVDTGRTVVCTIHQPSIDIFEAFDELFLMKRGGQVIYAGPLGHQSHELVEYFEAIPGVPKIKEGYNPATWMLDVSSATVEAQNNIDFAEIYANSELYRRNEELIKELSIPLPGSNDLHFPTQFSQSFLVQCKACFWKQHWSYWRNSRYNAIRFFMTAVIGIIFGVIFWSKGDSIHKELDLINLLGATYSAVLFLGAGNASAVQSVIAIERTVFYRERAAGMYSELPYAFAQVAIETIYVAIQTFMYSCILYSMIGYTWKVEKFFYFYYFVFMCFTYFTMTGMMMIALTPNSQIAAIVMSFFTNFWNLFSGFLIARPLIPVWWRWYYWGSPIAWTIYGIMGSQFGDVKTFMETSQGDKRVDEYLKNNLGYEHSFVVPVFFAHIGWVLLFFFVFAYGIKFLNFQKR
ncbi:pleiotropic drug resistance protein 2 [Prunus yedoensis var. nudiflora]|uniref:Pleiotropic drug resistance protein 2 n=1 Tax=Prunus yedoensis var. nudiflora TaxID=2094558 RepID=A0A314YZL3_PRUYE|nr:pleiotropic drug resistance protein 2 [Prunus yedoensis var. nudiflora]